MVVDVVVVVMVAVVEALVVVVVAALVIVVVDPGPGLVVVGLPIDPNCQASTQQSAFGSAQDLNSWQLSSPHLGIRR